MAVYRRIPDPLGEVESDVHPVDVRGPVTHIATDPEAVASAVLRLIWWAISLAKDGQAARQQSAARVARRTKCVIVEAPGAAQATHARPGEQQSDDPAFAGW